jgi:hypothetical protein
MNVLLNVFSKLFTIIYMIILISISVLLFYYVTSIIRDIYDISVYQLIKNTIYTSFYIGVYAYLLKRK